MSLSRPVFSKIIEQAIALARAGDLSGYLNKLSDAKSELEIAPPALRAKREALIANVEKTFNDLVNDASPGIALSQIDTAQPKPGISLVAGCMNREENLLKVLGSWLATDADEIVIVDWSSKSELWPKLSHIDDPRLKVIRIDGERHWVAAHALNVGLRFASHEMVFRVDCDINLAPDFLRSNSFQPGEFTRGFWKAGLEHGGDGQQFIQGTFGAWKKDLRATNYYDERILTYGWEDSELYLRLAHDCGLAGRLIDPGSLKHIEQAEEQRLANQAVVKNRFLGKFEPTEFEGAKNKFYTAIAGSWGGYFPFQDYALSEIEPRLYRGFRKTKSPERNRGYDNLAEILAAKQLTAWASASLPELTGYEDNAIDFARLMRNAHGLNKSNNLREGIKSGSGLYFIRCESGPCQSALFKTLQVMNAHYPSFSQSLVITEAVIDCDSTVEAGNILVTTGEVLENLCSHANVEALNGIGELEDLLESGEKKSVHLSLSTRSLASEAICKANHFAERLGGAFESLPAPVKGTCLVTSLYDEQNLVRLIEYLACVVENLRVFEQVVICYEANNGLLAAVLQVIAHKLAIPPGRLLIIPYQKRPTFEELFSVKAFLPAGTIIAVANADTVFDASLSKVGQIDLSRNMVVLSRRDISSDGSKASLIRLENGCPNTFSADAWIVRTPFEPDFFLDYPIGTMHCDSFINHQLSISSRYGVINPCFDIRVFHLHDERFNSSAEKQTRDFEIIKQNYNAERARNGDADPVKGVAWTTLAGAAIVPDEIQFQQWRPKSLVLNLIGCSEISFGHFLILHLMYNTTQLLNDVVMVIKLKKMQVEGALGVFLARYQTHFSRNNFLLDIDDEKVDTAKASSIESTVIRTISYENAADWIISGSLHYQNNNTCELLSWPSVQGTKLLRCEVKGDMSAETTHGLFSALRRQESAVVSALFEFFSGLPDYSAEKNLIAPFIVPQLQPVSLQRSKAGCPTVSFITSLFRGGEFLPGYLENVYAAAREAGGEVIIIDANIDDHDSRVVDEFLREHPTAQEYIDYVRLPHDPGLYECWKLGIERSRGDFITNANIDDRRCPHHTARLVQKLNEHPEYGGACGSISCVTNDGTGDWFTMYDNQLWFFNEGIKEIGFNDLYVTNEQGEVRSRDVMHCMPVWRKSLHERYGFFDEASYGTSADWAFWLKCSKAGEKFLFDEAAFGRYFLNPDSHNRRNDPEGLKERRIIKDFIGVDQSKSWKQ